MPSSIIGMSYFLTQAGGHSIEGIDCYTPLMAQPLLSLHIKRRPEALGHQKLSRASKFSFRASKFFFFFMFKNL